MTHFVGLDVSQKMTTICVVDNAGHRLWRGQCPTVPEQITDLVRRHAGDDARIGIETGARPFVALIVRPMLVAWRRLREQIVAFDKAIRALVKSNSACRLLMSVPGIGVLSALAYVSTVEDPARLWPITIGRRAPRAHAATISIGRGRSQWQNIEVWGHARSYSVVRGRCRYPVAGQESLALEGLGARDRQAIG
jgi:hypothetical protein